MQSYDDRWASDARRADAMRGANQRFPDLTPPPISTKRFAWRTLLGLAAFCAAVFVMWTGIA